MKCFNLMDSTIPWMITWSSVPIRNPNMRYWLFLYWLRNKISKTSTSRWARTYKMRCKMLIQLKQVKICIMMNCSQIWITSRALWS